MLLRGSDSVKSLVRANFSALAISSRNGSDSPARAHNPKVASSNLAPATKKPQVRGPFRISERASLPSVVNEMSTDLIEVLTRTGVVAGLSG